jgi:hypothetical protein
MNPWIPIIGLSLLTGVLSALLIKSRLAIIVGAAIPWLGVFAWIMYNEYFVPYQGGGASMWPIALIIAGSVAAGVGGSAAGFLGMILRYHRASGAKGWND